MKLAGPLVEERLAQYGTESQTVCFTNPSEMCSHSYQEDYISWLISYAPDRERNAKNILNRLQITNFAAIHTSTSVSIPWNHCCI